MAPGDVRTIFERSQGISEADVSARHGRDGPFLLPGKGDGMLKGAFFHVADNGPEGREVALFHCRLEAPWPQIVQGV